MIAITVAALAGGIAAEAAVINVTTNDSYTKIESANPGDEVQQAVADQCQQYDAEQRGYRPQVGLPRERKRLHKTPPN